MHRQGAVVQNALHQSVAGLMISREFLFFVIHQAPTLTAKLHFFARIIDVDHFDFFLVPTGRQERGFVQQISQLGAR